MTEKRFILDWSKKVGIHFVLDTNTDERIDFYSDVVDKLNEQQATINILLEELVNAQQQGYVIGFLHKNEHCNLIPKELENE